MVGSRSWDFLSTAARSRPSHIRSIRRSLRLWQPGVTKKSPRHSISRMRRIIPSPGFITSGMSVFSARRAGVKGLREAHFADPATTAEMITIELSEPPPRTEERTMPQNHHRCRPPRLPRRKKLADEQAAFAERVKAFEAEQRRRRHEGIVQFAAEQVKAARVLPKDKDGLVAFMDSLPADLTVELAEGDSGDKTKHDGLGWLRTFIAGLPAQVEFGEYARAADEHAPEGVVAFAMPQGYSVDTARLQLHRKALAYQHAHPNTEYLTAVRAVS